MRSRAVVTLAIAAVFAASTTGSRAADLEAVVAQGGGPGAGWVALALSADGSTVNVSLRAHDIGTPNAFQIYMYDAEDRFRGGFGRLWTRSERGVYVDAHAPGIADLTYEDTDASGTDVWEWSADVTLRVGVTKLLVWSGGPQSQWSWTLRGGSAVTLLASESGTGSHVIQSHDMSGTADVRAHPLEVPTCPFLCISGAPGARASLARSKTLVFENTPIGFYLDMAESPPYSNNLLAIDTPSGEELCIPGCSFPRYRPGWLGGSYRFRVDAGMGAVFPGSDEILAVVVDARLPAVPPA